MTPEAWNTLTNAAPWGVVMLLMFLAFLRFLGKKDSAHATTVKELVVATQERLILAAAQCHKTQDRATDALLKHAEASTMQAAALGENSATLRQVIMSLPRVAVETPDNKDGG